jgi:hypothetical protein
MFLIIEILSATNRVRLFFPVCTLWANVMLFFNINITPLDRCEFSASNVLYEVVFYTVAH